ncbi:hypothetical protein ASPBRDRAFT_49677 [Aspergillus brasiliensis CBS 101740]|uniref:Uncharacterized protein n=1 Tax=Aspergillus brasiliensis (strain CBS 101740 / IMI 381727 / IBT 21946) TaxID=767769 RepID=A0A1L9U1P5_ASPBC|nr:hypothetical protein ASPBRDRAFT_49677 [Aspergillus brasiliensis CBS 101740]
MSTPVKTPQSAGPILSQGVLAEGRDNLTGPVRRCLKVERGRSLKQAEANVSPRARAFEATCQDRE